MLRFLEFLTLDEDTVPANNIVDRNVDGYDPRLTFKKNAAAKNLAQKREHQATNHGENHRGRQRV
jgi:hypothetical protein